MSEPIFCDASHALHVSYLIQAMPATSLSPTAVLIDQLVKENHVWDEIPAPRESRVNFSGLTPLEVRAQCAQVVAMVNHLPHEAERFAVEAVYGRQTVKANGIRGLAAYCEPILDLHFSDAALYIAWHVFMLEHQREGVTVAGIAKHFGISEDRVRRKAAVVRRYGASLHARALQSLDSKFRKNGLIAE